MKSNTKVEAKQTQEQKQNKQNKTRQQKTKPTSQIFLQNTGLPF